MKRRHQYSLRALLVASVLVATLFAIYIQRVQSLNRFRQIANELGEQLPLRLDEDLAELMEQPRGLPIVHGVSGGSTLFGGLFSGSGFEKSYRAKIRFQHKDGTVVWPEGYNYNIDLTVNARLGIFNSQPQIEIIDYGNEYNSIGVEWMRQFFMKRFGIRPTVIESASRD